MLLPWGDGDTSYKTTHNAWSIPSELVAVAEMMGAFRFTSRQPMSSGATTSAGRAKKGWGRVWESMVAMGVAWGIGNE